MTFTGRIVKDAIVNQLKDDRKVVTFGVAVNDFYKRKGESEGKQFTTFIECSYWITPRIAERLKKGCIVEITGHPFVAAYNDTDGNAKARLNCHVYTIKIHQSNASNGEQNTKKSGKKREESAPDDLPF